MGFCKFASPFQHGNTSLHEAAWKGFSQTVSVLCKSKANFYIKNRGGFAPLHLCCQNGHNETCRVLLLNGCKPDLKNNVRQLSITRALFLMIVTFQYGDTPLHTSARYGHAGVIRILVSGRCNVSEQNKVRTSLRDREEDNEAEGNNRKVSGE